MFPLSETFCGQFADRGNGLLLAMFLAGVTGSFTHCATMCSPFVMQQIASQPEVPAGGWQKHINALLLPYHAGRLTTYTMLGVVAAYISSQVMAFKSFHYLSAFLLVIAAVMFMGAALKATPLKFDFGFCGVPKWLTKLIAPLFVGQKMIQKYLLGVVLGFIPCGLVFAALMAVASSGDPLKAFFAMIAFSLGTMPALMLVGVGSRTVFSKYGRYTRPISAALMAVNSFILFVMAGEWIV